MLFYEKAPWPGFLPHRSFSAVQKKLAFAQACYELGCGPVRRARRGFIVNEKGVRHPFFKLFPQTFLLLLCPFQ
jgi:hypothetical protein